MILSFLDESSVTQRFSEIIISLSEFRMSYTNYYLLLADGLISIAERKGLIAFFSKPSRILLKLIVVDTKHPVHIMSEKKALISVES